MIAPLTPLDFLARSAHTWRDRIAVVEGSRRFTYGEFAARVQRQAAALLALGVQPGDRVAVLAPNCAMALEAHFAPMSIGAVLVDAEHPSRRRANWSGSWRTVAPKFSWWIPRSST